MNKPPTVKSVTEFTELGTARRIAVKYADKLRYVRAWRSWLHWDGTRWKRDEVGSEVTAAKSIVEDLLQEASIAITDVNRVDEAEELLRWAKASSRANVLVASAKLAETEDPIAATAGSFDADTWLLNVTNGTIDLGTGELRPHSQADMITMLAPVAFDAAATCPRWDAFMEWMIPDPEVRLWLQRWIGHCLTGEVGEQIITFLHGGGANGKSTFLGVLKHILGDYALQGSPALLMGTEHGNSEELGRRVRAQVKGKRFVLVQEIEAGRYMNESQVKQLTGGDTVTAAKLYENEGEIMPTHKIAVGTNHRLNIRGRDKGIWRRIRLVPFTQTVTDAMKDPDLAAKLKQEAAGILAWAVRGCLDWQVSGLPEPLAMRAATADYRKHEDKLGEFLEDWTVPGVGVAGATLYSKYQYWVSERGEKPWTRRMFSDALVEQGYETGKVAGHRAIMGLTLRSVAAS